MENGFNQSDKSGYFGFNFGEYLFRRREAQDHAAASGQKQTIGGGGRDDRALADKQSSETNATKRADEQGGEAQNFKIKKRYFRSCSCLHKQKSKEPVYLYDEISQEQAEKSASYFIGYFKEGKLSRYEKIYEGERVFSSEDIKR